MEDRFMQWFIRLINLDMQHFKVDKNRKKQMYERIRQKKNNENGREKQWITKKQ